MIKAIIFDCFGVLASDGWLPLKRKYIAGNERLNQEVSDLGRQNEYGYIDNDEYYKQTSKLLGISKEFLVDSLRHQVVNEELFNYIKNKLKPAYKIGLLTNANYNVMTKLFSKEQAMLFDNHAMSFEDKLIKPDKRMFNLITTRLGVPAEECILIDDVERYCTSASDYGFKVIIHENNEQTIKKIEQIVSKNSTN